MLINDILSAVSQQQLSMPANCWLCAGVRGAASIVLSALVRPEAPERSVWLLTAQGFERADKLWLQRISEDIAGPLREGPWKVLVCAPKSITCIVGSRRLIWRSYPEGRLLGERSIDTYVQASMFDRRGTLWLVRPASRAHKETLVEAILPCGRNLACCLPYSVEVVSLRSEWCPNVVQVRFSTLHGECGAFVRWFQADGDALVSFGVGAVLKDVDGAELLGDRRICLWRGRRLRVLKVSTAGIVRVLSNHKGPDDIVDVQWLDSDHFIVVTSGKVWIHRTRDGRTSPVLLLSHEAEVLRVSSGRIAALRYEFSNSGVQVIIDIWKTLRELRFPTSLVDEGLQVEDDFPMLPWEPGAAWASGS